jgi:hypothetical protein
MCAEYDWNPIAQPRFIGGAFAHVMAPETIAKPREIRCPDAFTKTLLEVMIMKRITLLAAGATALFATSAWAGAATNSPDSASRLSQSECTNLWQQANPTNAHGLTQSQVAPYLSDFQGANPDGDTTIELDEWMAACNKGLVKSSSSTGASSGSSGAAPNPSEHAPTNRMDKMVPPMVPPSKE